MLVLEAGERRLTLAVLDLGAPPAAEWIRRLRHDVAASSGISYVFVAATHIYSGFAIRREYPPAESPDWESGVSEGVGPSTRPIGTPSRRGSGRATGAC
jgi:hypothetical protein